MCCWRIITDRASRDLRVFDVACNGAGRVGFDSLRHFGFDFFEGVSEGGFDSEL